MQVLRMSLPLRLQVQMRLSQEMRGLKPQSLALYEQGDLPLPI